VLPPFGKAQLQSFKCLYQMPSGFLLSGQMLVPHLPSLKTSEQQQATLLIKNRAVLNKSMADI